MIPPELAHLDLLPHPEGGFYRETFRSDQLTTIDYLLLSGGSSAFHRVLGCDEVWNHHQGGLLVLHIVDGTGYRRVELGSGCWSAVVPADAWQAAEAPDGWVHVGCTVAPPFDFQRFEMADRSLLAAYPQHVSWMEALIKA